jgi:hypothetical protein
MAFVLSMFAAITVQKNTRDIAHMRPRQTAQKSSEYTAVDDFQTKDIVSTER